MSTLYEEIVNLFEKEERKHEDLRFAVAQLRKDLDQLSGRMLIFFGEEPCPTCLGRGRVVKKEAPKEQPKIAPAAELFQQATGIKLPDPEKCSHPTIYDGVCQKCGFVSGSTEYRRTST